MKHQTGGGCIQQSYYAQSDTVNSVL